MDERVKFSVEWMTKPPLCSVYYLVDELSFMSEPFTPHYDYELIVNTLTLSIVNNKIIQLSGFMGLVKEGEVRTSSVILRPPPSHYGNVIVESQLENDFAWSVDDSILEYNVSFSPTTSWLCIGDPNTNFSAVEFLSVQLAFISFS